MGIIIVSFRFPCLGIQRSSVFAPIPLMEHETSNELPDLLGALCVVLGKTDDPFSPTPSQYVQKRIFIGCEKLSRGPRFFVALAFRPARRNWRVMLRFLSAESILGRAGIIATSVIAFAQRTGPREAHPDRCKDVRRLWDSNPRGETPLALRQRRLGTPKRRSFESNGGQVV